MDLATKRTSDLRKRGGRYWVRTSDLFGVNEARYHCANRPFGVLQLRSQTLTHDIGGTHIRDR